MDWDEMENSLPENWRLAKIFSEKEGGLFFKDYNGHFRQGAMRSDRSLRNCCARRVAFHPSGVREAPSG